LVRLVGRLAALATRQKESSAGSFVVACLSLLAETADMAAAASVLLT
jgi:hypothetical protein